MPQIDDLIRGLAELVEPVEFVPAEAQMEVIISCNQYELQVIAPLLVARVNRLAPGISLTFIQSHLSGHQQLQRGQCHLLLTPIVGEYESLYIRKLFKDRYVCLMSTVHPLAGRRIERQDYIAAKHVEIGYQGGWKPLYLGTPELQGVSLKIALRVPSVSNFIGMLAQTDLVMTLPERLARLIGTEMLIKNPPFTSTFQLSMYWNKMTHHSPAHQWLRDQVVEICTEIEAHSGRWNKPI